MPYFKMYLEIMKKRFKKKICWKLSIELSFGDNSISFHETLSVDWHDSLFVCSITIRDWQCFTAETMIFQLLLLGPLKQVSLIICFRMLCLPDRCSWPCVWLWEDTPYFCLTCPSSFTTYPTAATWDSVWNCWWWWRTVSAGPLSLVRTPNSTAKSNSLN